MRGLGVRINHPPTRAQWRPFLFLHPPETVPLNVAFVSHARSIQLGKHCILTQLMTSSSSPMFRSVNLTSTRMGPRIRPNSILDAKPTSGANAELDFQDPLSLKPMWILILEVFS